MNKRTAVELAVDVLQHAGYPQGALGTCRPEHCEELAAEHSKRMPRAAIGFRKLAEGIRWMTPALEGVPNSPKRVHAAQRAYECFEEACRNFLPRDGYV